jgi:hypothetical protein
MSISTNYVSSEMPNPKYAKALPKNMGPNPLKDTSMSKEDNPAF